MREKGIPSLHAFLLVVEARWLPQPPTFTGHLQRAHAALSLGACPQGLEGTGSSLGIRRTQDEGEKSRVGTPTVLLVGLFGRACQKRYGELAPVQTSSRNTENNHILLIIAKENTLRLQLNYIKT